MCRIWQFVLIIRLILLVINIVGEPANCNSDSHIRYSSDFLLELNIHASDWSVTDLNIPMEIIRAFKHMGCKKKQGKRGWAEVETQNEENSKSSASNYNFIKRIIYQKESRRVTSKHSLLA